jgi:hypothetical protein
VKFRITEMVPEGSPTIRTWESSCYLTIIPSTYRLLPEMQSRELAHHRLAGQQPAQSFPKYLPFVSQ